MAHDPSDEFLRILLIGLAAVFAGVLGAIGKKALKPHTIGPPTQALSHARTVIPDTHHLPPIEPNVTNLVDPNDAGETLGIRIGDVATYSFTDAPGRHLTITLTENQLVPEQGVIHREHPLAMAFLTARHGRGAREGDELTVSAGGREREVVIVGIDREAAPPAT